MFGLSQDGRVQQRTTSSAPLQFKDPTNCADQCPHRRRCAAAFRLTMEGSFGPAWPLLQQFAPPRHSTEEQHESEYDIQFVATPNEQAAIMIGNNGAANVIAVWEDGKVTFVEITSERYSTNDRRLRSWSRQDGLGPFRNQWRRGVRNAFAVLRLLRCSLEDRATKGYGKGDEQKRSSANILLLR